MVRASALGLIAALSSSFAVAQEGGSPAVAAIEQWKRDHREVLAVSAELMLWVGVCEPHMKAMDVTRLLREFTTTDAPLDDYVSYGISNMHMKMYVEGREMRAEAGFGAAQCQKVLDEMTAKLRKAQASHKPR